MNLDNFSIYFRQVRNADFFFRGKKKELFLSQVKVALTWTAKDTDQGVYYLFKGKLTSKRTQDQKTILSDTVTV